jgi:hypothetical protein
VKEVRQKRLLAVPLAVYEVKFCFIPSRNPSIAYVFGRAFTVTTALKHPRESRFAVYFVKSKLLAKS